LLLKNLVSPFFGGGEAATIGQSAQLAPQKNTGLPPTGPNQTALRLSSSPGGGRWRCLALPTPGAGVRVEVVGVRPGVGGQGDRGGRCTPGRVLGAAWGFGQFGSRSSRWVALVLLAQNKSAVSTAAAAEEGEGRARVLRARRRAAGLRACGGARAGHTESEEPGAASAQLSRWPQLSPFPCPPLPPFPPPRLPPFPLSPFAPPPPPPPFHPPPPPPSQNGMFRGRWLR
jgi:hypothetical protein